MGLYSPAFSPDGQRLLYTAGNTVRVRSLANGLESPLVADAEAAVWSPDGIMVAFTTTTTPFRLGITPVAGGAVQYASPDGVHAGFDADWRR